MGDLFQQNPSRWQHWYPVKDRERAKKIRLLRLPVIENDPKDRTEDEKGGRHDDIEDRAHTGVTTNTSRNASPRARNERQDTQRQEFQKRYSGTCVVQKEVTKPVEETDRGRPANNTSEFSQFWPQAHGDGALQEELTVQWTKSAENVRTSLNRADH